MVTSRGLNPVAAISNISHALTDQRVAEGKPFPLGAACTAGGVNFSVYSKNATGVELLLFDRVDDAHRHIQSHSIPRLTRPITTGTYLFLA